MCTDMAKNAQNSKKCINHESGCAQVINNDTEPLAREKTEEARTIAHL